MLSRLVGGGRARNPPLIATAVQITTRADASKGCGCRADSAMSFFRCRRDPRKLDMGRHPVRLRDDAPLMCLMTPLGPARSSCRVAHAGGMGCGGPSPRPGRQRQAGYAACGNPRTTSGGRGQGNGSRRSGLAWRCSTTILVAGRGSRASSISAISFRMRRVANRAATGTVGEAKK